MLDKIIEWDHELFLFLNSKNAAWLDPVMLFLSSYTGIMLICLAFLAYIYLKSDSRKYLYPIGFVVTVGMTTLLTNLIKVRVARPRPIHNTDWTDIIHAIERYSHTYSFFSSHSATTFAMAVFFFLFVKNNKSNRIYGYLGLIWAALVAYSRIYLAKHYPLDVACGILFGIITGILGYKICQLYISRKSEKLV